MRLRLFVYCSVLTLLLGSCFDGSSIVDLTQASKEKRVPTNFDYGHFEDSIYLNSFFGIEMMIPTDWHLQPQERVDELMSKGGDLLKDDSKMIKYTIEASKVNVAPLITAFENEYNPSSTEPNFSVILVAENVSAFNQIETGRDYLENSKMLLAKAQMEYQFEEVVETDINGIPFYKLLAYFEAPNGYVYQNYYSAIINDFSLCFILTSDEREGSLDQKRILESLKPREFEIEEEEVN